MSSRNKVIHTVKVRDTKTAKLKSEVIKVWKTTAEAEERSWLLQTLLREGIGTPEVENFHQKQNDRMVGKRKNDRDIEGKWGGN